LSLTCSHYHGEERHFGAKDKPYWKTEPGIVRRINALGQTFNFGIFNGAMKVLGKQNPRMKYFYWVTAEDDRVCAICIANSRKGRDGRFNVGWFLPMMPAHPGCRCQWMLLWF